MRHVCVRARALLRTKQFRNISLTSVSQFFGCPMCVCVCQSVCPWRPLYWHLFLNLYTCARARVSACLAVRTQIATVHALRTHARETARTSLTQQRDVQQTSQKKK